MLEGLNVYMQAKLNTTLNEYGKVSHGEKKALRQAKQAEWAFRVSKGYERDTFWSRLAFYVRRNH